MRNKTLASFLDNCRQLCGDDHVLEDQSLLASHSVDWTRRFSGSCEAVISPADVHEVAQIVSLARRHSIAIYSQGGNTSLVGGAVPEAGSVVLSTRRLKMIGDITESSGQISVGAGVTIAELAEVAHRHGWDYGIDLSSRTTATVGGTIATNAGGNNVAYYGDTRAQVAGIEAVLGTAEIVSHMSGLIKDNTGFALAPLFCGSEGTLGIVTAARLRLIVPPRFRATALLGFDNVTDLFACAANLRRQLGNVMSAEYLLDKGMSAAVNRFKVTPPFRENAYLVVEVGGNGSQLERLAHAVSSLGTVKNDAITEDPTRRGQLWQFRNGQSDALLAIGTPLKFDVTIPFPKIEETCARIEERISAQWPTAESYFFGHALDGNIHINILFATEYEKEISDLVLQRVAETGGAISAEHGIGRAKVDYLHLARSESEVELFHRIKQACDPDGILNPGVLLKSR